MKIIYSPEPPSVPQRPTESADHFLLGTIVEMGDGSRWEVYWDRQEHRRMWQEYREQG